MSSDKNYMTPGGAKKLREELKRLLDVDRPEVVRTVSWAASNGDRSENGDYIYGKRRLREIDRRIHFLTKRLESAHVIEPTEVAGDSSIVRFGAQVKYEDEDGNKKTVQLVGVDETDPAAGKISWNSPIGRALLNAKLGAVVTLRTPQGEQEVEVLEIKYL